MQELIAQIFGYLLGIWRFRWLALFVAWGIALAGWGFVAQMPDKYRASARVHVDTNSVLRPLLQGLAIQPNIDQRVALMSKTLLTRPNIEKLMRMADLDISVKTDAQKEQMINGLAGSIEIAGDRQNPSLYSIAYSHGDSAVAKRVVQSLITVFIESTLGGSRQDSSGAQSFLDQQIADYEKRLRDAEARLADFKQRYAGILPGESGGYYARLGTARQELNNAKLQLREMENRRADLQRQLQNPDDPMFMMDWSSDVTSPLDMRIQALTAKLDDLLTKYTELHPEVVQIRKMIAELEAERQQQLETAMAEGPIGSPGLSENPVYQQMRSLLSEADASVAEFRVRVQEHEQRVKELEDKVNSIPQIEAELTQLNRDYDVVRGQHSALLQRRESARMSEDVEQTAGNVVFRVIDPPFVPARPDEPNKLLLNSAVLLIAIGGALGVGLLLSMLRPVIVDRRSLGELVGLPVLGTVTQIRTATQRRRAFVNRMVLSVASVALLVVFGGINVAQQMLLI
jgi:polysaccharide chain length determinant protein (PEP-CTERM system associated)